MAHLRQQDNFNGGRQDGKGRDEGRGGSVDLFAASNAKIADALDRLADNALAQQRKSRRYTTQQTASIPRAGLIFQNLHLPEESAIGSANIENRSAVATLTVFEGAGAGGRVVGIVPPATSRRLAFADHLSSVSIVADVADPSSALVIATLTSHLWSPASSSIPGLAAAPPTSTSTPLTTAGALGGSGTIFQTGPPNTFELNYAMLSGAALQPGDRVALVIDNAAAILFIDETAPTIAVPLPGVVVTSSITVEYGTSGAQSINWAISGNVIRPA